MSAPGGDCPKCGARNTYSEKLCNLCGELLPWAVAAPPPAQAPPAAAPSTAPYAYPMRGEYAGKGGEVRMVKDLGRGYWFILKVLGIIVGGIFAFSFFIALLITIFS